MSEIWIKCDIYKSIGYKQKKDKNIQFYTISSVKFLVKFYSEL